MFRQPCVPSVQCSVCPMFLQSCVLSALCSSSLMSPQPYVPPVQCSVSPVFLQSNVPSALCSFSPVFHQSSVTSALCSFSPMLSQSYVLSVPDLPPTLSLFPELFVASKLDFDHLSSLQRPGIPFCFSNFSDCNAIYPEIK